MKYQEDDVHMREEGPMYGVSGVLYHRLSSGSYLATSIEVNYGRMDYEGETWDGTPSATTTDDWIMHWRGLFGYEVLRTGGLALTPLTGLGYRYWHDDIRGQGGYLREVRYWYVPLGLMLSGDLPGGWRMSVTAEYDLFLSYRVRSHLSDALPGYNDPEVHQDLASGHGVQVSAGLGRSISRDTYLVVEPFVRYWTVGRSECTVLTYHGRDYLLVYEPENSTTSWGIRLGVRF